MTKKVESKIEFFTVMVSFNTTTGQITEMSQ